MERRRPAAMIPGLALGAALAAWCAAPTPHSILARPAEYHGPERDDPVPDAAEVRIGLFAPIDPVGSIGYSMWRGADLAIEEANAEGGCGGKPFRLVRRWDADPWRGGSGLVVQLACVDDVVAIVGGPDGDTTHIIEQIATKLRFPLIAPISTDPSLTHVAVPWMFRLPPDDARQAELLAQRVAADGHTRVVLVSSTSHDGRIGAGEVRAALLRGGRELAAHLTLPPRPGAAAAAVERVTDLRPQALVLVCDAGTGRELLLGLRAAGFEPPLFGPLFLGGEDWRDAAEPWRGGAVRLALEPGETETGRVLERNYRLRFGEAVDPAARLTYDAVRLVVEAVRRAGPNRARVRDALGQLDSYCGASGRIVWDNGGGNVGLAMRSLPVGAGGIP